MNTKLKKRKTYPQQWVQYNEAQTKEKLLFYKLFDELINIIPETKYIFGRPNKPIRDMMFCCIIKIYSNTSSRRTISDLELAKKAGYINNVPHFNTLLNYFNNTSIETLLKYLITVSALPLRHIEETFAIDASGFGNRKFDRWVQDKYRVKLPNQGKYVKAHVTCGVKTNIVCSAEITEGQVHDNTQFKSLVTDTSKNFKIVELVADKGYSSRENMNIVDDLGAVPYIPFKSNTTGQPKSSPTWARMFKLFSYNYEEFAKHYHKRSNVESTFSMIKAKFGGFCRSKYFQGQKNEVLCKILSHNITCLIHEIFELKIDCDFEECSKIISAQ